MHGFFSINIKLIFHIHGCGICRYGTKENGDFGFEKAQCVPNRIQEKSNIKSSLMNIKSGCKENILNAI